MESLLGPKMGRDMAGGVGGAGFVNVVDHYVGKGEEEGGRGDHVAVAAARLDEDERGERDGSDAVRCTMRLDGGVNERSVGVRAKELAEVIVGGRRGGGEERNERGMVLEDGGNELIEQVNGFGLSWLTKSPRRLGELFDGCLGVGVGEWVKESVAGLEEGRDCDGGKGGGG